MNAVPDLGWLLKYFHTWQIAQMFITWQNAYYSFVLITWQNTFTFKTLANNIIFYNITRQNAQTEFEERALYLTERRGVFDSIYRREHMEQSSRMHRVGADTSSRWI